MQLLHYREQVCRCQRASPCLQALSISHNLAGPSECSKRATSNKCGDPGARHKARPISNSLVHSEGDEDVLLLFCSAGDSVMWMRHSAQT
uniref:Uncharacterized protein n=1 Tax=Knipowitschia caucasica TaxID=637954 RepID=A0AAV2JIS4_KNICA